MSAATENGLVSHSVVALTFLIHWMRNRTKVEVAPITTESGVGLSLLYLAWSVPARAHALDLTERLCVLSTFVSLLCAFYVFIHHHRRLLQVAMGLDLVGVSAHLLEVKRMIYVP